MVFDMIRYSNFGSLHKFPVEFISYLNLRISKSQKYYIMLLHHNNINRNNNLFLTYDLYIKWVIFKSLNNINRNSNLASIYDLHAKWKIFQSCMITIQITKNTVPDQKCLITKWCVDRRWRCSWYLHLPRSYCGGFVGTLSASSLY